MKLSFKTYDRFYKFPWLVLIKLVNLWRVFLWSQSEEANTLTVLEKKIFKYKLAFCLRRSKLRAVPSVKGVVYRWWYGTPGPLQVRTKYLALELNVASTKRQSVEKPQDRHVGCRNPSVSCNVVALQKWLSFETAASLSHVLYTDTIKLHSHSLKIYKM